MRRRAGVCAAAVAAAALTLVGCTGPRPSPTPAATLTPPGLRVTASATSQRPLVVETVFDDVDLDPSRQFGRTNGIVGKALYQTLTTLEGDDESEAGPGLAQYTISPEGNWLTLRLRADARFSDGAPVTTDDVIFSLERAQGLGGAPSRVLGSVTMTKVDERTMTITSPGANFALPAVLANPAFGVLNSRAVKARGATIGPHDAATAWLQTHSAGSGPYVLASRTARSITLTANPEWRGPAPAHPEVVLRDASPAVQVAHLEAGRADVVLDLSPGQAAAVERDDPAVRVVTPRSVTVAYLALDASPRVSRWTADPDFAQAVRLGIDRAALSRLVGGGATAAPGLIAQGIVGALKPGTNPAPTQGVSPPTRPAPRLSLPGPTGTAPSPSEGPAIVAGPDLAGARAALRRAGYRGERLTLVYVADQPIEGVAPKRLAQAVADQLDAVGIAVRPEGVAAARAREPHGIGGPAFALSSFTPRYPSPEDYLVFAPGHPIGLQAGWRLRADPVVDELTIEALGSVGADRPAAYGAWQRAMNRVGPFVPLVQPHAHYGVGARVSVLATNPSWTIDLAQIR